MFTYKRLGTKAEWVENQIRAHRRTAYAVFSSGQWLGIIIKAGEEGWRLRDHDGEATFNTRPAAARRLQEVNHG